MSYEKVVDVVRDEVRDVPTRSGDLQEVIQKGKARRLRNRIGASAIAVGVGAVTVGLGLVVGPSSGPVASNGTLELTQGFTVQVSDSPVESEGALIFVPDPGPSIAGLDIADLGTEVAITPGNASDLVVPTSGENIPNSLSAVRVLYIGDIGIAQVALHPYGDDLMVYLGNGTKVSGGGSSVTCDGLAGGDSADPDVGKWLVWTRLPESTAVVVGESADGTRYWQHAVGRTVVFILPDRSTVDASKLTALDANGSEVATTSGLDLNLGEIGFHSVDEGAAAEDTDSREC